MNHLPRLYLLLIIAVTLSGCVSNGSTSNTASNTPEWAILTVTPRPTTTPTLTATRLASPTIIPPTSTSTSTQTPTLTPPPTLEPDQAEEAIQTLLEEPLDCLAPCFWGITPGQTMLGEATNIITRLGLPVNSTTVDQKIYYGTNYKFESGLSIRVVLPIHLDIVKNVEISITPEKSQPGVPREWLAYSPETLIARYGPPSKAGFWVTRAAGPGGFSMVMYFDEVDLIVEYDSRDFDPIYAGEKLSHRVCLLTNEINHVRVWMGKNPENPPGGETPLEEAAALTLEEFAALMLGDPENACVELKDDAFP